MGTAPRMSGEGSPVPDPRGGASAAGAAAAAAGGGGGGPPPSGAGTFSSFVQEKSQGLEGRRVVKFFFLDAHGKQTLAAVGEERETRDGHYVYRKVDTFPRGPPLQCSNLAGVHAWLAGVLDVEGAAPAPHILPPAQTKRPGSSAKSLGDSSHGRRVRQKHEEFGRFVNGLVERNAAAAAMRRASIRQQKVVHREAALRPLVGIAGEDAGVAANGGGGAGRCGGGTGDEKNEAVKSLKVAAQLRALQGSCPSSLTEFRDALQEASGDIGGLRKPGPLRTAAALAQGHFAQAARNSAAALVNVTAFRASVAAQGASHSVGHQPDGTPHFVGQESPDC